MFRDLHDENMEHRPKGTSEFVLQKSLSALYLNEGEIVGEVIPPEAVVRTTGERGIGNLLILSWGPAKYAVIDEDLRTASTNYDANESV